MAEQHIIADQIIRALKESSGIDYSFGREQIADTINEDIWNGNWDATVEFLPEHGNPAMRDLRIIEENEYDQSMSDDEKPDWDDMICECGAGYVFYA
jgi:hypothetical protein